MKKLALALILVLGLTTPLFAAGQAILSWTAPTTNSDGTPLTDLGGYKVYQGTATRVYGTPTDVGNVLTKTITPLADGTYFFAVTAYDTSGNESVFSNEVSKRVDSVAPAPPSGFSALIQKIAALLLSIFKWFA